jgi:hypothetical protein
MRAKTAVNAIWAIVPIQQFPTMEQFTSAISDQIKHYFTPGFSALNMRKA